MTSPTSRGKKKVAVLGGGVGAISAAFELTSPRNPRRDEYEVTVYQVGWRIGGKGASGRNAAFHQRIEEHGLHIWMGWYHNAFRLAKECYAELGREPGRPLSAWSEAFKPHSFVTLMDRHRESWKRWDITFPRTADEPGDGYPSLRAHVSMLLGWLAAARAALRANPVTGNRFLQEVFGVRSTVGLLTTGIPGLLLFLRAVAMDRRLTAARCRRARNTSARIRARVHGVMESGAFDADDMFRRLTEVLDLLLTRGHRG